MGKCTIQYMRDLMLGNKLGGQKTTCAHQNLGMQPDGRIFVPSL